MREAWLARRRLVQASGSIGVLLILPGAIGRTAALFRRFVEEYRGRKLDQARIFRSAFAAAKEFSKKAR